jgi:hypothetical protein
LKNHAFSRRLPFGDHSVRQAVFSPLSEPEKIPVFAEKFH